MTVDKRTVRWIRLDRPGTEVARLYPFKSTWHIQGTIETELDGIASKVSYHVSCDRYWCTRVASIRLRQGPVRRKQGLSVDPVRGWHVWGKARDDLRECIDVDFELSPATNTLRVRRLALEEGEAKETLAAWVRIPQFTVEPLRQRYTRIAQNRYRYESLDSGFTADIDVDDAGLVVEYPGLWRRTP